MQLDVSIELILELKETYGREGVNCLGFAKKMKKQEILESFFSY